MLCHRKELLVERKQLPQIVDNGHSGMELMEAMEPLTVGRSYPSGPPTPSSGLGDQVIVTRSNVARIDFLPEKLIALQ